MRRTGILVAGLLWSAAPAAAQVTQGWHGLESYSGSGADAGVEIVYWKQTHTQPPSVDRWVFVAGTVTDGSATRIAVWKYRADAGTGEQSPQAFAYFPPAGTTATGVTKATGIAVDSATGDVYVSGYTRLTSDWNNYPAYGNDYNYVTLKLDGQNLAFSTTWDRPDPDVPYGFRLYHGGYDDKAVDIKVDNQAGGGAPFVYVTGSSGSASDGLDIVTLKYEQDGGLSSTWPDPSGVRRYDHNGGDDVPAGLVWEQVTEPNESEDVWVFIGGTVDNGTDNDLIVIAYDADAKFGDPYVPAVCWANDYDGGDQDVATGVGERDPDIADFNAVVVTGYSVVNGATGETDYVTAAYLTVSGNALWDPEHRYWDGPEGGSDFAASAALGFYGGAATGAPVVWITGKTEKDGAFDVGTALYSVDEYGLLLCEHTFEFDDDCSDRGAAITANEEGSAWVGGSTVTPNNIEWALTLRLDYVPASFVYADPCTLAWSILHPLTDAINPNSALGILIAENGDLGPFITGRRTENSTGEDAVTVRYYESP